MATVQPSPAPAAHPLHRFIAPSQPLRDARDALRDPVKWWKHYVSKFRGTEIPSIGTPAPSLTVLIYTWLGAFIGIFAVALITYEAHVPALIGSFGATAVLIYGAIESPLAQPKNVFFGQMISAFWGVCVVRMMEASGMSPDETDWRRALAAAGAVSGAIFLMQLTRTTHPPGGATALIAVSTPSPCSPRPCFTPWTYIIWPVALGCGVLLFTALLIENLGGRRYPVYWWAPYRKPGPPPAPVELEDRKRETESIKPPAPIPPDVVIIEDTTDEEMKIRQYAEEEEVLGGEEIAPGAEFEEFAREMASYGEDLDARDFEERSRRSSISSRRPSTSSRRTQV